LDELLRARGGVVFGGGRVRERVGGRVAQVVPRRWRPTDWGGEVSRSRGEGLMGGGGVGGRRGGGGFEGRGGVCEGGGRREGDVEGDPMLQEEKWEVQGGGS